MDDETTENAQSEPAMPPETGSESENTTSGSQQISFTQPSRDSLGSWIWHHIGIILGLVIALLAVASVVFLTIAGFTDALVLLIIIVFGMAMIIMGGRIRSK